MTSTSSYICMCTKIYAKPGLNTLIQARKLTLEPDPWAKNPTEVLAFLQKKNISSSFFSDVSWYNDRSSTLQMVYNLPFLTEYQFWSRSLRQYCEFNDFIAPLLLWGVIMISKQTTWEVAGRSNTVYRSFKSVILVSCIGKDHSLYCLQFLTLWGKKKQNQDQCQLIEQTKIHRVVCTNSLLSFLSPPI